MRDIGQAEWIGTTARDFLARRDCVGRVLAVVTGAVYVTPALACGASVARSEATKQSPTSDLGIASQKTLAMTEGEVLWLSQNHLPMHPRAIRGDFDFDLLQTGMTFKSDGACLRFANDATLRFADARVWQPKIIDPGCVAPREVVIARVREFQDPRSSRKPLGSLRELVGLGEGLTPSGDDFIGGMLFAQWHFHQAYPGSVEWNQIAIDDLIDYARARTNGISHAILRDHAHGQSIEPMHDLIVALLQGEPINEIMSHIERLLAIGNTSGQEMLAGLSSMMIDTPRCPIVIAESLL